MTSQSGSDRGEPAPLTQGQAEVERVTADRLDPFGRPRPGLPHQEEVTVRRPPGLPGVEMWTSTGTTRLWVLYHWAYGFCMGEKLGRHVWRYRRQVHDLTSGSTMLLEPGEVQVTVETTAPSDFRTLLVLPDAVERIFGNAGPQGRHFNEAQVADPTLAEKFAALWSGVEAGGAEDLVLETRLQDYLASVFTRAGERPPVMPATGCERAIRRAREYVEDRFAAKITLDDLAREAGLSKFHLERSFTNKMGIALYQFVKKVRINRALEMLRSGPRPAEVAPKCGFSDQPHMTRVFREDLGVTPRQYWAAARTR